MSDNRTTGRLGNLLRLPSFGVALFMSLAALLGFAVWMFVDASFDVTLEVVRIDLGLQEHPGVDMSDTHAWDQLGSRLVLFAVLAGIGVLSTLLVFYRIVFGRLQGRSLRSLFLAVALVGLWLTLGISHKKLESAGFQWRLRSAVQGLKQDAEILVANWPTTNGELPYSGAYTVEAENPHFIFLRSEMELYSTKERVGPFVTRTDNGAILFDYIADKVEFHPTGSKPSEYTQVVWENGQEAFRMRWIVDNYIELEPNWFFVAYVPEPNPAGIERPEE